MPKTDKEMTVREAGEKGVRIVSQRHGKEFYEEIGKKGGSATKSKYGPEFYGQIGKKGGQRTAQKHGPEFYEKIGKKGGQRVKELVERAVALEHAPPRAHVSGAGAPAEASRLPRLKHHQREEDLELGRLREALQDLMPAASISGWLERPNPAFDGLRPVDLVEQGA